MVGVRKAGRHARREGLVDARVDRRATDPDLAREIGRSLSQPQLARFFGQGEAIFGRVIAAAAPDLEPDEARELARRVLAIIVAGPTTGLAADPVSVRAAAIDVLRLHLIRVGVDADRFDGAMVPG